MVGWNNMYGPFASHSPYVVDTVVSGGVLTDAQKCKFNRPNKSINPIRAKQKRYSKHLGSKKRTKRFF